MASQYPRLMPRAKRATKPVVLIGPMFDDPTESVSAVNQAFATGLADRYTFIVSTTYRRFGAMGQAYFTLWNLYYLAKHLSKWVANLVRHRPDVAHYAINFGWTLWKSLLFLRIAGALGARTAGHLHSGNFLEFWEKLPAYQRQLALRQFRRLDAFIVLSESWRRQVSARMGLPLEKLYVVNNPIDRQFESTALSFPLQRPGNIFLSVGVMQKDKGIFELLAATAALRKRDEGFTLRIVGAEKEPGLAKQVTDQINDYNLHQHVSWEGSAFGDEKLRHFREAGISILPSYFENFPLVILEAAAAGHAIITTPVGAVPEFLVNGVSAIFVEPGNVDQLAAAMSSLLKDPELRFKLAKEARRVFLNRLVRSNIMDSLSHVYGEMLHAGANGA